MNNQIQTRDPVNGQFKEGNTFGNGRPVGSKNMTSIIREALYDQYVESKTVSQAIVNKLTNMALEGNLGAIKLILAYSDGAPRQMMQEAINPTLPYTIVIKRYGDES